MQYPIGGGITAQNIDRPGRNESDVGDAEKTGKTHHNDNQSED